MPDILDSILAPLDTFQNAQNTANSLIGSVGKIGEGLANTLNSPIMLMLIGGVVLVVVMDRK